MIAYRSFALVDDDAKFLAQTARLVKLYLEGCGRAAEVATFASAEALPETAFDLYLLDVVMPGRNGIELARRIRRTQPEVPILFFTTSRDFAVEAFGLEATDYVVKPFEREALVRAMDRALRRLKSLRPTDLTFKDADGVVRVAPGDLVLVETAGHHVIVHIADGRTLIVRQAMQDLWEKLKDGGRFVRLGRQAIVSLAHVTRFAGTRLTLAGGKTVSVSRRALSEFKTAFASYYGS